MRGIATGLVLAVLLSSCGPEKTEEERLADHMDSWHWRGYRYASEKLTRAAVAQYNKTGATPTNEAVVHLTLSTLWFLQGKSEFCYIEADMARPSEEEGALDYSLGLKTVALYGMELPELSNAHYEELKASLAAVSGKTPEEIQVEHKLFLTSLIVAGFLHWDPEMAKFGAKTLGATAQVDYLEPLVVAIVEAKEGHFIKAKRNLVELSKSERFHEHARALFREAAAIVEDPANRERIAEAILERLPAKLVGQVLDDIFAEENQKALLDKLRQLPERIQGEQLVEDEAEEEAPTSAEEPEQAPAPAEEPEAALEAAA